MTFLNPELPQCFSLRLVRSKLHGSFNWRGGAQHRFQIATILLYYGDAHQEGHNFLEALYCLEPQTGLGKLMQTHCPSASNNSECSFGTMEKKMDKNMEHELGTEAKGAYRASTIFCVFPLSFFLAMFTAYCRKEGEPKFLETIRDFEFTILLK